MRIALPSAATAASRDVVSRVLSALKLRRNRRALHDLDNDLLKNIGISRANAQNEANRAVWDAPNRWHR